MTQVVAQHSLLGAYYFDAEHEQRFGYAVFRLPLHSSVFLSSLVLLRPHKTIICI